MIIKQKFREAKNMPKTAMENYISYMEAGSSSLLENPREERFDGSVEFQFNQIIEMNNMPKERIEEDFKEQPLLFSREGEDISELKRSLIENKGNVWIPIISLKESEALEAGLESQVQFRQKGRQFVELFSEAANIPMSNLNYMAVMHQLEPDKQKENKDSGAQPHLHFIIWEKEPLQEKGQIDKEKLIVLVEDTKDLFIKEKLTSKEREQIEFGEDVSLGRDLSNTIYDISQVMGETEPSIKTMKEKVKDLYIRSGELRELIVEGEETVDNEVELVVVEEDIRTMIKSMSVINTISEELSLTEDKESVDKIADILLKSGSKTYRDKYLDSVIANIPYVEISPIESDNPVLELSLDINAAIKEVERKIQKVEDIKDVDIDPKTIELLAEKMSMVSEIKSISSGKNLEAYAEFNRVLENSENIDKIIEIVELGLVSEVNLESLESIKDFKETIEVVKALSDERLSYPELKSEIKLLENLSEKKFSADYVPPIISGLEVTFVEQYELMTELLDKMDVEYKDNILVKDSIHNLRSNLDKIEEDVEKMKSSLTLEERDSLEEQKERHLSIEGRNIDVFKESQPEFKAREWALIEVKWLLEENIDLINECSGVEPIKEVRHFNFNKDYERVLFDKQVGARISQIEEALIDIDDQLTDDEKLMIVEKNILINSLVDIHIDNEVVLSDVKREYENYEISGLSDYISKDDLEKESHEIEYKSEIDERNKIVAEVLQAEEELLEEIEEEIDAIDDIIEEEMEERREYHRQVMRALEIQVELDEQERIRLQYMLIQLEAQLRMNPESIKEDIRYFSMMNNLDVPSVEHMDSMIDRATEDQRGLSMSQEETIKGWFDSVPELFLNPTNDIYDDIRNLSEASLEIIYEKTQSNPYFGEEREVDLNNYKDWMRDEQMNPLDVSSWHDIAAIMPEISEINGIDDWKMPPFPLKTTEEIADYIEYLQNPEDTSFDHYFQGYTGEELDMFLN